MTKLESKASLFLIRFLHLSAAIKLVLLQRYSCKFFLVKTANGLTTGRIPNFEPSHQPQILCMTLLITPCLSNLSQLRMKFHMYMQLHGNNSDVSENYFHIFSNSSLSFYFFPQLLFLLTYESLHCNGFFKKKQFLNLIILIDQICGSTEIYFLGTKKAYSGVCQKTYLNF